MSLYGQEPETALLRSFIRRLENRTVIDVGAERGAFAVEMLEGGATEVHVIEPEPANARALRERFADAAAVTVHECAISDADRRVELRRSRTPSGEAVTFAHTLLDRPGTDAIVWDDRVDVEARSLASLVAAGDIPARIGVLKIDTEGHDFSVVDGMGDIECDVVMVEHWQNLPDLLGPCPWSAEEMVGALARRGFSHYAFIAHLGEFVIVQWMDATVSDGHMGNLVFLHDRVVADVLPDVLECSSQLASSSVAVGEMYATAARERLELIHRLEEECELRQRAYDALAAQMERDGLGSTPHSAPSST